MVLSLQPGRIGNLLVMVMNETAAAHPVKKHKIFTGHFPVGKNLFLRYAGSKPAGGGPSPGTIIFLAEWGQILENNYEIMSALNARGFHAITYEWHARGSPEPVHGNAGTPCLHFNHTNLDAFFHTIALPDFPSPFHVLAKGTGGLFALTGHNILRNQIHRMLIASPILEVRGQQANSLYHQFMRLRSLISWNRKTSGYKNSPALDAGAKQHSKKELAAIACQTPHWRKMVLDAAAYVLSPAYCEYMALPTLFILSTHDPVSNPRLTEEFASRLRMAESIIIHSAAHDILCGGHSCCNQFWKAFDTFIPGSGTVTRNPLLEGSSTL